MLDISSKYTDIEVVGTFKDKFNVLSGKTFLFSKIKSYLQDAGVTYVEIPHNASSSTVLGILSTLQEGAVVVYDSLDIICIVLVLYLWRNCNGFIKEVLRCRCTFICMRNRQIK